MKCFCSITKGRITMDWVKKNRKRLVFSSLLIISFFTLYLLPRTDNVESSEKTLSKEEKIPTVFVHGFKGTYNSFKTMMDRFENQHGWGQKTLTLFVSEKGIITYSGNLPKNPSSPPLIQVVFESNRASIPDTTQWLENVMKFLYDFYGVRDINIVGHSMGGLVSTLYLQNSENIVEVPKPHKFITIGSPFLGVTKQSYRQINTGAAVRDLMPNSKVLNNLYKNRGTLPKDIKVFAIASTGDQVVSVKSATAIQRLFPRENYQQEIIYDPHASHSGLHESVLVDHLIGEFLWKIK
jgi:uncharacterized alpha/beta hydrolase family protein